MQINMSLHSKIENFFIFHRYKKNNNSLSKLYYEVLKINKKIDKESFYTYSENEEKYIRQKIILLLKLIEIGDFYHPNYKNYYDFSIPLNDYEKDEDNLINKRIIENNKKKLIKRILYANKAKKLIIKVKNIIDKKTA